MVQPGLHRPRRHLQNLGDLLDRHAFEKVQRQHFAVRQGELHESVVNLLGIVQIAGTGIIFRFAGRGKLFESLAVQAPTTTAARPVVASSAMTGSSIDPAAVSVALSLSQLPAMPAAAATPALWFAQAPLSVPSLTSNLPPAGQDTDSTDLAQTSTPAADWVFASLDGDLSLALLADDPAFRPRD